MLHPSTLTNTNVHPASASCVVVEAEEASRSSACTWSVVKCINIISRYPYCDFISNVTYVSQSTSYRLHITCHLFIALGIRLLQLRHSHVRKTSSYPNAYICRLSHNSCRCFISLFHPPSHHQDNDRQWQPPPKNWNIHREWNHPPLPSLQPHNVFYLQTAAEDWSKQRIRKEHSPPTHCIDYKYNGIANLNYTYDEDFITITTGIIC